MTTTEKIVWLAANAHTLHVDVNDHRSCYETPEELVEGDGRYGDMTPDEIAQASAAGTIALVQVYPDTPVGFVSFAHADLDVAIGRAYEWLRTEKEKRR